MGTGVPFLDLLHHLEERSSGRETSKEVGSGRGRREEGRSPTDSPGRTQSYSVRPHLVLLGGVSP